MFNVDKFICEHVINRDVSMFLEDIKNNNEELSVGIKNKSVLVIGGAGSIGKSFIKALLPYKPKSLVIVDINENALAELTRDLRSTNEMYIPEDYAPYPMDYYSKVFEKMFRSRKGFDIVANFSAHKHVRSEKDIFAIEALLQNNLLHAKSLLDLLLEFPPEEYFCVSTDKATNPVNIMGASKRIMEDLIFAYSDQFPVKTARFANVAFSNGSLPAGFLNRISNLQPLSAPTDIKRYFVSPEESGQICLLACILGKNREIFFPKLSETQMVTFDTIARKLLNVQGFRVLECSSDKEAIEKAKQLEQGSLEYPVYFSKTDTSGEKNFEEFYTVQEKIDSDRFIALGVIIEKLTPDSDMIFTFLKKLEKAFLEDRLEKEDIVSLIKDYIPNFQHIEKGRSLDTKM